MPRCKANLRLAHILACSTVLLATTIGLSPGAASAQEDDTAQTTVGAGANNSALAPIVIQGSQSGGDAGASSFSALDIERMRLTNFEDALRATPGVNVNTSGGANLSTIYIRGVGPMYPMNLDDSPAGVAIDGFPVNSRHISLGTLDVERIEILKGPQSTHYAGLGASGLVDVTTRQPTRELEGYVRTEYGQERQRLVEGAIGGPLLENVSGRLAFRYSGSDHWVTNLQNGEPLTEPHDLAVRGSLLWDIDEKTSALFTIERQEIEGLPNLLVLRPYGDHPSIDITPGTYDDVGKTVDRYAVKLQHDFDRARITSRSSFTKSEATDVAAYDQNLNEAMYGFPSEYWIVDEASERVFNQEIRLSSLPGDAVDWHVGLAVETARRSYDTPRNTYGSATPTFRDFDTTRYGVFGEIAYPVQEDLKLIAGLRQSWDRTSYSADYYGSGAAVSDDRKLSDTFTTGKLGLSYAVTPETDIHATFSRGYTPGGFNIYATQPADSEPYHGATTDMFEIGFNTDFAGGAFSLSGAAYVNRVKDNHLLSYDSMTYVVSALNADTRSMGAELQGTWRPGNGFEIMAGLSYVDAEIRSNVLGVGDGDVLAGNKVPDVSPWSASLAFSHSAELPAFLGMDAPVLNTALNYKYVGERPADPQNHFDLESYHKLDLRVGLSQGQTELYARADNILDEQIDLYGYYAPAAAVSYGSMARRRTFLVGLTHRF